MSKKDEPQVEEIINEEKEVVADIDNENINNENSVSEEDEENLSETDQLKQQLEASKKEYMFLMAEFDNFRKRTIKEKAEIIRNATEKAMKDLLPVVDDFERGLSAMAETTDAAAVKDGMDLI